jgi:hypothetical protein
VIHRLLLVLAVLAVLAVPDVGAQGRPTLESRLDAQTLAALRPVFAAALSDSLPVRALEDKAFEGAAKRVPAPRIVAAVRQLATELREARILLYDAAPGATRAEGEIIAAADARRRGVPANEISALRRNVSPATALMVPLTVFADLVQRGIAADQARAVLEQLLAAGVAAEQIAEIPARVDVALRVGAPPLEALRSALPVPLRPVPLRPPARPPSEPSSVRPSHRL